MAPLPTTPAPRTLIVRRGTSPWTALMTEHEQPMSARCLVFVLVILLVLALLVHTGRSWDECNDGGSPRRRICQRCRDSARAQAAELGDCQAGDVDLSTRTMRMDLEGAT
ncbi:hypothetical protein CCM_05325 [Cordyceps militaris CM01]|uniref:Uncharacterized protein n=1 Tax=Cordyceps militaris (strain CM01) TaxID=983644 RepID=G3JJ20_CORMM|nr:uncharacterized protein CCM_05325 [Cordyceps militaris CM01]EGX91167.1 hypothetical protein CCM_05325 [Cordyceps militaris CM01]